MEDDGKPREAVSRRPHADEDLWENSLIGALAAPQHAVVQDERAQVHNGGAPSHPVGTDDTENEFFQRVHCDDAHTTDSQEDARLKYDTVVKPATPVVVLNMVRVNPTRP